MNVKHKLLFNKKKIIQTYNMKRILVPTDFSPTAERALRVALDISSKSKGTVILYHVYTPVGKSTSIGMEKTRKQYDTQTENNLVKRLQRCKKKVMGNGMDVPVSTVVGRSPIINNILGFVEDNHIDLIVMGTQGASGLKKVIVGSVAARLIEKSDIPVLLVPEKFEWKEPEQIVFATNYQKTDRQALTLVLGLATLYNTGVTVLHFLSAYTTEIEKEKKQKGFDTYAYALQREFNESKLEFHLLNTSSVTKTMENLDKKFPYDMLAMVRRKKSFPERFFLKSFTQNMAYVTRKPLLVVPEVK